MTQLFDTETYADDRTRRHLRSLPAGQHDDIEIRKTQWRLDAHTIEVGRKGLEAARQALRDSSRSSVGEGQAAPVRKRRAA